ncbi:MAG: hypothetical protein Q8Q81_10795 [Oxalobacteraceae bacterium]|nr:hypothetical protein [Oxalobacteraceae bacterium]
MRPLCWLLDVRQSSGEVIGEPLGVVLLSTVFGGERFVDTLVGE